MVTVVDTASDNIALSVPGATYLIANKDAENFLRLLLPAMLRDSGGDQPGMNFLQGAIKTFIRMSLPKKLKEQYGDDWHQHMPPAHTDLLKWTLDKLISDTVSDLSSRRWQLYVSGDSEQGIYHVRGLAAVATSDSPIAPDSADAADDRDS